MTYLIFHIVGYNKKDELGNYLGRVVIRLIDTTYESALSRAMKIIDKDNWELAEVVEYNKKED
jgi:hypothetical protein